MHSTRAAVAQGARAVALWDIDTEAVEAFAKRLSRPDCKVQAFTVDVSSLAEIQRGVAEVREQLGSVDILINNAGIVTGRPF